MCNNIVACQVMLHNQYTQWGDLTQRMEWSSWDKTGHDVPSQTTLPATHTLCPYDDKTHEAHGLDGGSVCLTQWLNVAHYTVDMPLPLPVSW